MVGNGGFDLAFVCHDEAVEEFVEEGDFFICSSRSGSGGSHDLMCGGSWVLEVRGSDAEEDDDDGGSSVPVCYGG